MLHHITSYYIILHHIRSYYIILHHITSCYIILHHSTSYYIILHHITSYYMILHHIASYYILPYISIYYQGLLYFFCLNHFGCSHVRPPWPAWWPNSWPSLESTLGDWKPRKFRGVHKWDNHPLEGYLGKWGCPWMGYPNLWLVYVMDNPSINGW